MTEPPPLPAFALAQFPCASFDEVAERLKVICPSPFVLQIGAMDGVRFDLLHKHLSQGGWRGLLVEPSPDMFALLQKTYADQPDLKLVNCAIADYNGKLTLQRILPDAVAAGLVIEEALGVTSALPDRGVLGGLKHDTRYNELIARYIDNFIAPCVTLPHLLDDHAVEAVDLVVIDCEGADWMVARQFDLVRYRPFGFCIEFTSLTGDEMRDCCAHFSGHGYQLTLCREDNQNLLFIRAG